METLKDKTKADRLEALASELRMAVMRTSRRLRTEASGDALTPGQISVLSVLRAHPLSLGQLAEKEHVQAPSMTRTVNALVDYGLVIRTSHPSDGRQALVEITEAGRAAFAQAQSFRTEWLARRLADLPDADLLILDRAAALLQQLSAK
jgi:DNA-binding MarR family transcriptional regulator